MKLVLRNRPEFAGPLFLDLTPGKTQEQDPMQKIDPSTYAAWLRTVFERAGGGLEVMTTHSIRRSAAQWAKRCGVSDSTIMAVGFWRDMTTMLVYLELGQLRRNAMIDEAPDGIDPIERFWSSSSLRIVANSN